MRKVVIELTESEIESCLTSDYALRSIYTKLVYAVRKGIVLPKGHGRLIDADKFVSEHFGKVARLVDDAPTIIEADEKGAGK